MKTIKKLIYLLFVLFSLTGCEQENIEALKQIKTIAVPTQTANLSIVQEYIDKFEVNAKIINNIEINKDYVSDLTPLEKKYLDQLLKELNNSLLASLKIKPITNIEILPAEILPREKHLYVAENKVNFNYKPEYIQAFCKRNNCDAVASLQVQFVRARYTEFFNLKFAHKAKAKCLVEVYAKNGEKVYSKEFQEESKNYIPAYDFFLATLASKEELEKYNNIQNNFSLRDSMKALYKEAATILQKEITIYLEVINNLKNKPTL